MSLTNDPTKGLQLSGTKPKRGFFVKAVSCFSMRVTTKMWVLIMNRVDSVARCKCWNVWTLLYATPEHGSRYDPEKRNETKRWIPVKESNRFMHPVVLSQIPRKAGSEPIQTGV